MKIKTVQSRLDSLECGFKKEIDTRSKSYKSIWTCYGLYCNEIFANRKRENASIREKKLGRKLMRHVSRIMKLNKELKRILKKFINYSKDLKRLVKWNGWENREDWESEISLILLNFKVEILENVNELGQFKRAVHILEIVKNKSRK